MDKTEAQDLMNRLGAEGTPFLFLLDFELKKPVVIRLNKVDPSVLLYSINGRNNCGDPADKRPEISMKSQPESFEEYLKKFELVKHEISLGNSFLLNLTCSTPVELNVGLKEVFMHSRAPYRIWLRDEFVCFSPETFITVKEGRISSFPMKGTIDADIPGAEQIILADRKETAEHYTIVDLIRNDLSRVSSNVRVERLRYTEIIETRGRRLLQVSSEICGDLEEGYACRLGDILFDLLPAGSVSGAPKKSTTGIIAEVEGEPRGYYCGVCGIFDGKDFDSFVMIRYIENRNGSKYYRSGGGITSFSDARSEYNEMKDKIYVPFV